MQVVEPSHSSSATTASNRGTPGNPPVVAIATQPCADTLRQVNEQRHTSQLSSAPGVDLIALASRVHASSHLTGSFRLRSGQTSSEYFDKYLFESDPVLLRTIAEALAPLVPHGVDALAGLELGGVPIATMLSQVTGIPARFVRKEAKTYGTCRLAGHRPLAA